MTSTSEPVHLNHHHRDTLAQIFTHPLSHNIEWRAVLSLLEALGAVEIRPDGKFVLTLGPKQRHLSDPETRMSTLNWWWICAACWATPAMGRRPSGRPIDRDRTAS